MRLHCAAASSSNDAVNIEDDVENDVQDTEAWHVPCAEKHHSDRYKYGLAFSVVRDRFAQQVGCVPHDNCAQCKHEHVAGQMSAMIKSL